MNAEQVVQHSLSLSNAMVVDELVNAYHRAVQDFGCKYFILTGLPSSEDRFDQLVLERVWPEDWMSHYVAHDYVRYDPIVLTCMSRKRPFTWKEAVNGINSYGPTAERIMMEAVDAGLRDGFCVPVVVRNAFTGCISIAADAHTNADALPSLNVLSLHFASRLQILTDYKGRRDWSCLSEREREVMTLVRKGKTTWEISRILGVSESTANKHVNSTMRKLDCVNRPHAVYTAHKLMEIT